MKNQQKDLSANASRAVIKKALLTILCLAFVRVLAHIPVPGVSKDALSSVFGKNAGFRLFDLFSGGALSSLSVAALSVTPYITASILIELLSVALPPLETIAASGESGNRILTQATRVIACLLAVFDAAWICLGYAKQGTMHASSGPALLTAVAAMTAGSVVCMWAGERITDHGIGNGVSLILVVNILSRVPDDILDLIQGAAIGHTAGYAWGHLVLALLVFLASVLIVLRVNGARKRIPVSFIRLQEGREIFGGDGTGIPVKVNTAGVMPAVFAVSVLAIPGFIQTVTGSRNHVLGHVIQACDSANWFYPSQPLYTLGFATYVLFAVWYAFAYTNVVLNPAEIADRLKKAGGTIPGVLPGKETEAYLRKTFRPLIWRGVFGLLLAVIFPMILSRICSLSWGLSGTSLLIVIAVGEETIRKLRAAWTDGQYAGLIRGQKRNPAA